METTSTSKILISKISKPENQMLDPKLINDSSENPAQENHIAPQSGNGGKLTLEEMDQTTTDLLNNMWNSQQNRSDMKK